MESVVFAAIMIIGLLGGTLFYVIMENYIRERKNKQQLSVYEQELTAKLIALRNRETDIIDHQYVCTGETLREALDRIERQIGPIEKEIEETSKKLTDILIEKL